MGSFIFLLLLTLLVGIFPLSIYLIKTLKLPSKSPSTLDGDLISEKKASSNQQWWEDQRGRFNMGLIYGGIIAFGLYLFSFILAVYPSAFFETQNLFSFLFIVVGYLIYMGVANLFYYLGPIFETVLKPIDTVAFRDRFFKIGYWFAILLPFLALIRAWINFGIFKSL